MEVSSELCENDLADVFYATNLGTEMVAAQKSGDLVKEAEAPSRREGSI